MRHRRRLTDIRYRHGPLVTPYWHPEGRHRHIRFCLDVHPVAHERPSALMCLSISSRKTMTADNVAKGTVIIGKQVPQSHPPVRKEAFTLNAASHDFPRNNGQPAEQGVPAALLEFCRHGCSPVLMLSLITVS